MQQCIKILLFRIYIKLNMFQQHTDHHQEPKTAPAASGFSYVEGCWTCSWWTLSGTECLTKSTNYKSKNLPRKKNQRLSVQF
jgi:hypothetical protein